MLALVIFKENKMKFMFAKGKLSLVLVMIALGMFAVACGSANETSVPGEVEKIVAETMQALPTEIPPTLTPFPTATLLTLPSPSPTSIPPTATSLPAPTAILPGATRINFAPGATYGIAQGTIPAGGTMNYVLKAQAGQPMLASVGSPNNDVTMTIIAQNGVTLLPASQKWSNWQGTLPDTQDYYFQIIGGSETQNFTLWVSIPSRIQFSPGAVSATVSGATVNGYIASYVVSAQGGQTMDIQLYPDPNAAALTVWGFSDGQPYMRAQMGSTTFNMQLPSTQDYIIDVVPQGGQEVEFTMSVEIK